MKHLRTAALAAMLLLALAGCSKTGGTPEGPVVTPTPAPAATEAPAPAFTGNPLTGAEDADYTGIRPVAVTLRTLEGSGPLSGLAAADVLIAGVTEGNTATLMALYANVEQIAKAGPVGPGRDLTLQMALPLNAVPVHIDKNIYARNLLELLTYRDLDGYHIGKAAFTFDNDRNAAGYREENCWYTGADLIRAGLARYEMDTAGPTQRLFQFARRPAPTEQNAVDLTVQFSSSDVQRFLYDAGSGLYRKVTAGGDAVTDPDTGEALTFTNVFVLYASSGIKDDRYTRQYDMSGGNGLYLTEGGWERIQWTKGDATAPLIVADMTGQTLAVNPGKSYIALWGGYYGQKLTLLAADGSPQTLPDKPALLESGVSDEDAAAAEAKYLTQQAVVDAQAKLTAAKARLSEAQRMLEEAQQTEDPADDLAAAALIDQYTREVEDARNEVLALGVDPDTGEPLP